MCIWMVLLSLTFWQNITALENMTTLD